MKIRLLIFACEVIGSYLYDKYKFFLKPVCYGNGGIVICKEFFFFCFFFW